MKKIDDKLALALSKSSLLPSIVCKLKYVISRIQKPCAVHGQLSDLQSLQVELVNNNWRITTAWIAYELCPEAFDIRKKPFNRSWYHKKRTLARLYCSLLILCENCFDNQTVVPPYSSEIEWWIACIRDFKENDIISIFRDAGLDDTPIRKSKEDYAEEFRNLNRNSKDNYVKGLRASYRSLKDDRGVPNSWKKSDHLPVVSNLLETALELAWGNKKIFYGKAIKRNRKYFRENYWNLFLDCFDSYINDVKNGTWWTGFFVKDSKLYYYARGSCRILSFKEWHKTVQHWYLRKTGKPL